MRVLIFGCGYLGAHAAEQWRNAGHEISVVTRSHDNAERFNKLGYRPFVADITQSDSITNIPTDFDVVLFSVGFDRSKYADIRQVYVDGLQNVLTRFESMTGHFVYISSTGVYGDCQGQWIDETTVPVPIRPGGKACLEAEEILRASTIGHTILRLAGIYGPGRVPRLHSMQAQAWDELGQSGHINLIQVVDAAKIITNIVERKIINEMFLVSDGHPPERKPFYEFIAEQLGVGPICWETPTKEDVTQRSSADKKVSNRKLLDFTEYTFQFPDFRAGIVDAIGTV